MKLSSGKKAKFGPRQITKEIEQLGPFKIGNKRVILWKFKTLTALLQHVGFLRVNAVEREVLKRLVTSSLPVKRCTVVSLTIANTSEDQLGFPIFRVTQKSWVMKYAVVEPPLDGARNPIETGDWGTEVRYATYDRPLKRDAHSSKVVDKQQFFLETLEGV